MIDPKLIQHLKTLSEGARKLLALLIEQGNTCAIKSGCRQDRYPTAFAQLDLEEAVEKSGLSGMVLLRGYGELIAGLYIEDNDGSINIDPDYIAEQIGSHMRLQAAMSGLAKTLRQTETGLMNEMADRIELDLPDGFSVRQSA